MPTPDAAAPGRPPRRLAAGLIGFIIAAGLLYWALRGVHLEEVARHIRSARPGPLIVSVIVATLTFPIRMVRWRLLLRNEDGSALPLAPLWHAVAIGFTANNLLPFRAGELVRVFAAARLARVRLTAALSSVAVERIFDGLVVVALLSLALLASDLPPGVSVGGVAVSRAAQTAGAMGVAALVVALLVVAFPLAAERAVRAVLPAGLLADRIVGLIEGIRQGLSVLRSPALLAGVIVWSLILWLANAYSFYAMFQAFDIPVDFLGAIVLQGIVVFGISVQLTPGYVGQFEAAVVAGLGLYGIPNDLGSSYALTFHGTTFVPIILLGAWSLARTPVALTDLRRPEP